MAQVGILIGGRRYRLGCRPGEEARLQQLASILDGHVTRLTEEFGRVGDERLLMMAGLMIADELLDARAEIERLQSGTDEADEGNTAEMSAADVDAGDEAQVVDSQGVEAEVVEANAVEDWDEVALVAPTHDQTDRAGIANAGASVGDAFETSGTRLGRETEPEVVSVDALIEQAAKRRETEWTTETDTDGEVLDLNRMKA